MQLKILGPDASQRRRIGAILAGGHGVVVHVAPEVGREDAGVEQEDAEDESDGDGGHLAHHDDGVQEGGAFDAADDQVGEGPHHDGSDDDAGNGVTRQKCGVEVADGGHHHRGEGHVAEPRRQPVTPAGDETGERAPTGVRVGEDAVQIAALLGEVVQRERQRQKADAHNEPCNEHRSRGGHAGQLTGDGEHARADARADHHADEPDKPNAFLFLFHTSIPSLAGLIPTSALCARCPHARAAPWRRGPALATALSLNEPPGENERPVTPMQRHTCTDDP